MSINHDEKKVDETPTWPLPKSILFPFSNLQATPEALFDYEAYEKVTKICPEGEKKP